MDDGFSGTVQCSDAAGSGDPPGRAGRECLALIIPALNEEAAIGDTLAGLAGLPLNQVLVVDNGSTDRTAEVARAAGAEVIYEPRRGYGRACLAGIAALRPEVTLVVFMDADGSDVPEDLPRLLEALERDAADLVVGARAACRSEAGALAPAQRFGNWLSTHLLRLFYGARYSDLGPFRVIRRDALRRLNMQDPNFGWTIEMQIKAHRAGLRVCEIPVSYRKRRRGSSKVSGTVRGTILAGTKILWTILRYRLSGQAGQRTAP